jgi:hypothetical protein
MYPEGPQLVGWPKAILVKTGQDISAFFTIFTYIILYVISAKIVHMYRQLAEIHMWSLVHAAVSQGVQCFSSMQRTSVSSSFSRAYSTNLMRSHASHSVKDSEIVVAFAVQAESQLLAISECDITLDLLRPNDTAYQAEEFLSTIDVAMFLFLFCIANFMIIRWLQSYYSLCDRCIC